MRLLLRKIRVLTRPRYRANWILGRYHLDGFVWYVRGTDFPMNHEDWLRSFVHPFQGDLFLDVGAHVGTWAVRATRSFRQVVAIEPHPAFSRILRTTIAMNNLHNITVVSARVSSKSSDLPMSPSNPPSNRRTNPEAPIRTLDSFNLKPSLIKIDTEGSELPVLHGAIQTLTRKPMIVVETHSPESLVESTKFLAARGYATREIRHRNRFDQIQSWLLCN
jgi:FkbM family methyltransferase